MIKKKILVLLLSCLSFFGYSNLDSLTSKLKRARNDSAKIVLYYKYSLSDKYSVKVIDSLMAELDKFKRSSNCYTKFFAYFKTGQHYSELESQTIAIENLLTALRVADSCKNEYAIMLARNKLALVNKVSKNFKAAIFNAHASLFYARRFKDSTVLSSNYTLLGNMYKTDMILDSALTYHFKALAIRELQKDPMELSLTYNNLGLVYKNKKEYRKALDYLRKSLQIKLVLKDKSVYSAYNNISIVYKNMGLYDSSIFYSELVVAEGLHRKNGNALAEAILSLAENFDQKKDLKNAVYYYRRLIVIEDSLNKEKISTQFQDIQSKYESDKKDTDLKLKGESLKTAEALNSRKNILIWLSSLALFMALIASVFIFRSYKQSKRNATQLEQKNKIIEEKNREITDSINYAKNIQQSLITNEKVFAANLKDHFILYLPKDIVSGDFYWAQKTDSEFIIVCADCTGHGVPGAFMSLMAIGYLKEIVNQKQITKPDIILNELRDRIIEGFSLNNNKDGMDASLIKLNGLQLQVAAANNPIWIIRNNENIVVRPDKFPIGNYLEATQPFSLNTIELKENDLILMYTDGYADQFGGPNNKKHKNKAIEKLILDNHHLPLEKIKNLLHENLKEWQGNNEQVDDILVIGFRV